MRNLGMITAILFLISLFTAPAVLAAGAYKTDKPAMGATATEMSDQQVVQRAGQQGTLMQTDHLIGTDVQNRQGEKVGEIENVILDIERGQIAYVIVTGGGVIGLGDEEYIVPFNALQPPKAVTRAGEMAEEKQMFTLTTDKEKLRELPEGDIFTSLDQDEGAHIHQYYGVSPYWEQGLAEPFELNPDN